MTKCSGYCTARYSSRSPPSGAVKTSSNVTLRTRRGRLVKSQIWSSYNSVINCTHYMRRLNLVQLLIFPVMAIVLVNPLYVSCVDSLDNQRQESVTFSLVPDNSNHLTSSSLSSSSSSSSSSASASEAVSFSSGALSASSSPLTSETDDTELNIKLSTVKYLARNKNRDDNAQMLPINCTEYYNNNESKYKNISFSSFSTSSNSPLNDYIPSSPWNCDLAKAQFALNPSCHDNCLWCNQRSFLLWPQLMKKQSYTDDKSSSSSSVQSPSSSSSSSKVNDKLKDPVSNSGGISDSSSQLDLIGSKISYDYPDEVTKNNKKMKSKFSDECLTTKTVNELCNLTSTQRLMYSNLLHLPICERYSLQVLTNSSWTQANYTACQFILNYILDQDNLAAKLSCQFDSLLARYNCQSGYSVKWNCSACSSTYRDWICATVLPYYHVADGKFRKPCREFCERVEQRCPYFHPAGGDQYAGEPAFLCTVSHEHRAPREKDVSFFVTTLTLPGCGEKMQLSIDLTVLSSSLSPPLDPHIPFLTPEVPFGPDSECYTPCDLDFAKVNFKTRKLNENDSTNINSLSLTGRRSEYDTDIVSAGHCWSNSENDDQLNTEYNECRKKFTTKFINFHLSPSSQADTSIVDADANNVYPAALVDGDDIDDSHLLYDATLVSSSNTHTRDDILNDDDTYPPPQPPPPPPPPPASDPSLARADAPSSPSLSTSSQLLLHDHATAISISVFREDTVNLRDRNKLTVTADDDDDDNNQPSKSEPQPSTPSSVSSTQDTVKSDNAPAAAAATAAHPTAHNEPLQSLMKSNQLAQSEDIDNELDSNALLTKSPDLGNR